MSKQVNELMVKYFNVNKRKTIPLRLRENTRVLMIITLVYRTQHPEYVCKGYFSLHKYYIRMQFGGFVIHTYAKPFS